MTCLLLLLLSFLSCTRPSNDPQQRIERLGGELRCPVCRGVSIADSPSALASEMMGIVRSQVAEGKSDEEIRRYFVDRYGEWALLRPKPEGMNLLVWLAPLLFLVGGAALIVIRARRLKCSPER